MPHLNLQIATTGEPLIDLLVNFSYFRIESLNRQGKPVPAPIAIRALIDTGASCSAIDHSIVEQLQLVPTGMIPVHTPSTKEAQMTFQYDVSFAISHPNRHMDMPAVAVVEADLAKCGFHALLGRDFLNECLFVYDGQAQMLTIAF